MTSRSDGGYIQRLVCLGVMLLLTGCEDPIEKVINSKFPPVSVEQQRTSAVVTSAEALGHLTNANVTFGSSLDSLSKALVTDHLKGEGIREIKLTGDRELVRAEIGFQRKFSDTKAVLGDEKGAFIDKLGPEIKGVITVYAGIDSAIAQDSIKTNVINLRLLPAIDTLKVQSVEIADGIDVGVLGEIISKVLTKYADNISGQLSKLPLMTIDIPTVFIDKFNPSGPVQLKGDLSGDLTIGSNPISPPVKLDSVAWLITEHHVAGLAQIIPTSGTPEPPYKANVEPRFEALQQVFLGFINNNFGLSELPQGAWVGVKNELASRLFINKRLYSE